MTPALEEKTAVEKLPAPKDRPSHVRRHAVGRTFYFGRTIALNIIDEYLEMATAAKFGFLSRLLDITRLKLPQFKTEKDRLGYISLEIDKYCSRFGGPFTRYIMGVGNAETAFRIITLPDIPPRDLPQAVYWEAQKRIPFGIDNARFGFHKNETIKIGDEKTTSVSLLAVSRTVIESKLKMLGPLADRINLMYNESEAVGHILPHIENFSHDKSYALINVKKETTEINFYRGARIEFMLVSSIGYKDVSIDNIADEKYRPFIESLINEIQNSLDYYVGQYSVTTAEKVYVYGELAFAADLLITLTRRFGIEFQCFPLGRFLSRQSRARAFAEKIPTALGIAALAMTDRHLIDFLPERQKERQHNNRYRRLIAPAAIILTMILSGLWLIMNQRNHILTDRLIQINNQIDKVQLSQSYVLYNKIKHQLAGEQALVNKLTHEPTHLHLGLKELSRITPDKIVLQQYELQNVSGKYILTLQGRVISLDPPPEIILADFAARLEASPFYENILVSRHIKKLENGTFRIEFRINSEVII
jgi:Tfp pilus assembly PilM family ATPase